MIDCNFTKSVWQDLLDNWHFDFNFPTSVQELFAGWMARYPGAQPKNKKIKAAWSALPKFTSWKIWLERNMRIFRDKAQYHRIVANTVKCQLSEWLEGIDDDSSLSQHDRELGTTFKINFHRPRSPPPDLEVWQIRKK